MRKFVNYLPRKGFDMSIGLLGLLGVVFVTLKLCNVIAWSWWLVLLPFYGGIVAWVGILIAVFLTTLLIVTVKEFKN